ncbi:hypothetical protein Tco_0486157, partial [Tanacetum coccineum]
AVSKIPNLRNPSFRTNKSGSPWLRKEEEQPRSPSQSEEKTTRRKEERRPTGLKKETFLFNREIEKARSTSHLRRHSVCDYGGEYWAKTQSG